MISLECDYLEGCHENVLNALIQTNLVQQPGYGTDAYTESAKQKIRKACACEDADIYFITGGTQTNQLVIETVLESYEGVLCADSGYVNVHEAGAIEYSGHKVLPLAGNEGKVNAADVENYVAAFYGDGNHDHMVFPGMVYISHPTEYGTLYTAEELRNLSSVCRKYNIPLYLDGARLAYGLAAQSTDVTLPIIAELCDMFYIGGTKCGALCGEALVFTHGSTPKHFITRIKQHGALNAKGRLIGVQFDALFTDDLYFNVGKSAITIAMQIRNLLQEYGYEPAIDSFTNQQFVVMENENLDAIAQYVKWGYWEKKDETHTVIRFATSWATQESAVEELRKALESIKR